MKIRNGFVSNSSSSSFVLVIKTELFEKIYRELDKKEKFLADKLVTKKDPFVVYSYFISQDGYSPFDDFDGRDEYIKMLIDNEGEEIDAEVDVSESIYDFTYLLLKKVKKIDPEEKGIFVSEQFW